MNTSICCPWRANGFEGGYDAGWPTEVGGRIVTPRCCVRERWKCVNSGSVWLYMPGMFANQFRRHKIKKRSNVTCRVSGSKENSPVCKSTAVLNNSFQNALKMPAQQYRVPELMAAKSMVLIATHTWKAICLSGCSWFHRVKYYICSLTLWAAGSVCSSRCLHDWQRPFTTVSAQVRWISTVGSQVSQWWTEPSCFRCVKHAGG